MKRTLRVPIILLLWIFFAGCPELDPEEIEKPLRVMLSVPGRLEQIVQALDLDPGEEARVAIMDPETGGYPPVVSVEVTSASIQAARDGGDYLITGINPGGMGIVKFSAWGKSGELRVFVRNWKKEEVFRHPLYADTLSYPFDINTPYSPEYYNDMTPPYKANRWSSYRLITDSGFHYEAPDGLSRRITTQFTDRVHTDSPREIPGWREIHDTPHIIMERDDIFFVGRGIKTFALNKDVFQFIVHFENDGDMVGGFADRQRLELKTMDGTWPPEEERKLEADRNPANRMYSNGGGDTFTHRWKFRLPQRFYVSSEYTHIHQIKPEGGDSGNPTFTLTARRLRSGREVLQLIYRGPIRANGDPSVNWYPAQVDLEPFKGEWIYAEETVTYDDPGAYRIRLVRIRDMKVLMEYIYSPEQYDQIDPFVMFRKGNSYIRPKFGLYRRILHMTPFGLPNMDDPVTEFLAENNEVVVLYADLEMDKLKR